MKRMQTNCLSLLLLGLVAILPTGCGGGGGGTSPEPAQTGDTALFANANLLASAVTLDNQNQGVIVLDARHSADAYNAGHIPGAIHAPCAMFLDSQTNLPLNVAELETILGKMGIARTSSIVIYDDTINSLGAAGELFWLLEYLGCTDVSILNGGWDQWVHYGRPVDTAVPAPVAVTFTAQVNTAISVTKEEVYAAMNDPAVLLVDARAADEYLGQRQFEVSTLGHIPWAVNVPYTACFNKDRSVMNQPELKKLFDDAGITEDKKVYAYSTVGKRSAYFYFLSRLMGYKNVVNFPGSLVLWDQAGYPMETN